MNLSNPAISLRSHYCEFNVKIVFLSIVNFWLPKRKMIV